jgi:L-alanine-DL-glutamate epimerase-like enolase superfamily enzyme
MKITDIRCYVLPRKGEPPHFHWRTGLRVPDFTGHTLHDGVLRVDTDEGITGYATGPGHRLADIVAGYYRAEFLGTNPLNTEKLWHRQWELRRLGVPEVGIMDRACWDIKSRKAGLPLYQLLGGNDPKVPAYASTVTWDTVEEYERHIKECMDEGFFAFKLHASGDAKWDARLCHELRRWVGDDADLMFDASDGWDYVTALWFGRQLEDARFLWYEEPMREYDLPSYVELCAALDIPILGAETCEGAHWNMATWINMRALDMVRCSTAKGGYTGAIKVVHLAEAFGMRAQVHGYDPTLCAAIPNNDYAEILVIDSDQIRGLKKDPVHPVIDGYVTTSDEPGLGTTPDWKELQRQATLVV